MNERKIVELDLNDILPNRFQPRIKFSEETITELAESIREHGVIQPIVVRPLGDRYEIIAGERRYKASVLAGKDTIPAIVTELNDKDSAEVALIENVQRQDLTPIEEAISYKKILDMGYMTQEDLAEKLGKTQSTIANKLRLLNLDDEVQEALLETKISERHARSLLKLTDKEKQRKMLQRIISERLTVRRTDEEINKMMNDNRNIEILDFGEETSTPSVQPTNNLNIPTSPIVEDVIPEEVTAEPSIKPTDYVNPGFMNVEQIEKEATDIHPEQPVADMDALLKPNDILNSVSPITENPFGTSMETTNDEEEAPEAILKPGKFFNFSDLEESTTAPVAESIDVKPVEDTILTTPMVEPTVAEPKLASSSVEEPISDVSLERNNFITNFDQGVAESSPSKPTPIIPVNPEPLVQTPVAEPMSNKTVSVPSYSELDAELYGEPSFNEPAVPENKMKQVIDLIRECSKKIESLGFVIETEEYDFEDMYQAIFKINKK